MAIIQGEFRVNGNPRNGNTAKLYPASGFVTAPIENTAFPATGLVTSTTTGPQHGTDGGYRFTSIDPSDYYVGVSNGTEIRWFYHNAGVSAEDLFDPTITNPQDGDFLRYEAAGTRWINDTAALDDLSDVVLTSPATGQALMYASNATWVNTAIPKRAAYVVLMEGYTPTGTGGDAAQVTVPYSPVDGTTVLQFNVRRIDWRVSGVGTTSGSITVEKSTGTGAFSASTVGTLSLAAADHENNNTTSLGTIASGDKLRVNVTTLGDKTGWTIGVLLEAVA
jgi:hypothetical protein